MYELTVRTSFAAAHQLAGYNGACETLHGHNWKVEVIIRMETLNDIGIGKDFKEIKNIADTVLSKLDHTNLNEVAPFDTINPSSENIAKWLYSTLAESSKLGSFLKKIIVYETDNFSASYQD